MTRRMACVVALVLGACGGGGGGGDTTDGQEASAQYAGPIGSSDAARGEEVYNQSCAICHNSGPSLENIGWSPARLRQQIREGSGRMPAISANRVSDADMEAILAYMVTTGGAVDEGGAPASAGDEAPAEEAPVEEAPAEDATDA